jgi:nitrite reductase (NADH) large subunit
MNNNKTRAWVCSVCGYVHHGAEPPDCCPVCGASGDLFEPYEEPGQHAPAPAVNQWRCLNCEYIHDGDEPPEVCPVCAAAADRFEPYTPSPAIVQEVKEKLKVVIVGAGIAGVSAAESLKKSSPGAEITILSKESDFPYYRLNLTRYLAGEVSADQLPLHPPEWYDQQGINLLRSSELNTIDLENKELTLRDGSRLNYEKLVLTAGSHPFVPPVTGVNKENVSVLRTRGDADRILEVNKEGGRCVCIGGGLLGLETAGALARRGADVTILEGHGWLLPRQLNKEAGERLEVHASSLGISLQKKARAREIIGDERVRAVLLDDGTTLPAELVIIATGVRSNSYLARLAGLEVHHGIVVDDRLRTSNPDVYAAGDIAEHRGVTYGTWGPSQFQGTIAGLNVSGTTAEFVGIPRTNMLKVLGYDLFSVGQILTEDASYETMDAEINGHYFYFVFRDNHMVGAILLGDTELSAEVKTTVEKRLDCSDILKKRPGANDIISYLMRYH